MVGVANILKKYNKKYGDSFATSGSEGVDFERLPTGVFNVDLMSGGGFAQGKISQLHGPKSSCKTTLAIMTLVQAQRLYPDKIHVWVDAEWGFDTNWAKRLGVDLDAMVMIKPETGEEVVDAVTGLVEANDLGLLVIDSIAGIVPISELEGDASRMQVGGNSMLIGKMVRKLASGLIHQARANNFPTVLVLNQIRKKVGVMFGNPETCPGGHALEHYLNMDIRMYAKDVVLKEVSTKLPALKTVSLVMKKWKLPIVSTNAEFSFAQIPHGGLPLGGVPNLNTLVAYAKEYGFIIKDKKWYLESAEFSTLQEIGDFLMSDAVALAKLQAKVIHRAVIAENHMEV